MTGYLLFCAVVLFAIVFCRFCSLSVLLLELVLFRLRAILCEWFMGLSQLHHLTQAQVECTGASLDNTLR